MKRQRSARPSIHRLWPVIMAVLLVGAACSSGSDTVSRRDQGAGEAATIRNLSSIDQLQEQFNRDQGVTRLILLISPT